MDALPIAQNQRHLSGVEAVLDMPSFKTAMKERGSYKCGFNLMMLSWTYNPMPSVPLRMSSVSMLKDYYFEGPGLFPGLLEVALPNGVEDPRNSRGDLQCISPPEMRAALFERIAEAIDRGEEEEMLQRWAATLRTVSVHFRLMPSEEEVITACMDLREHLVTDHKAMARTTRQWIFTIVSIKEDVEKRQGSMSDEQLADYIREHVNLAVPSKEGDAMSKTFVGNAIYLYNQIFADGNQELATLLEECEERWGPDSPFNQISKLTEIITKCKEHSVWAIRCIMDGVTSRQYSASIFNSADLKGDRMRKGWLDVFLAKRELKEYFLNTWLPEKSFPGPVVQMLRQVYENHKSFRKWVPITDSISNSRSWTMTWSPAASQAARFIEDVVYLKVHDGALRYALKSSKKPEEWLDHTKFDDILKQIDEDLAIEKKAAKSKEKEEDQDMEEVDVPQEAALEMKDQRGLVSSFVELESDAELDEGLLEEFEIYRQQAEDFVNKISLVPEPDKVSQLTALIRQTMAVNRKPESPLTVFWYNVALCGESVTQPRVRKPPMRSDHFRSLISGCLQASGSKDSKDHVADDVVFVIFDAGKGGPLAWSCEGLLTVFFCVTCVTVCKTRPREQHHVRVLDRQLYGSAGRG